jgi:hypothetical protein
VTVDLNELIRYCARKGSDENTLVRAQTRCKHKQGVTYDAAEPSLCIGCSEADFPDEQLVVRPGFVRKDDREVVGISVLFEVGLTITNQGMDLAIRLNTHDDISLEILIAEVKATPGVKQRLAGRRYLTLQLCEREQMER